MRIMWIAYGHNYAAKLMKSRGIKFVERIMHRNRGCVRVFITSEIDFDGMTGFRSKWRPHWQITACNKQYVTIVFPNHTTKYLGSMCKVETTEAFFHTRLDKDNWYLLDVEANVRWIASDRNPTTRIVAFSPLDTPLFPKQTRSWPLKGQTYEEWKRGVVKAVVATLDEAL